MKNIFDIARSVQAEMKKIGPANTGKFRFDMDTDYYRLMIDGACFMILSVEKEYKEMQNHFGYEFPMFTRKRDKQMRLAGWFYTLQSMEFLGFNVDEDKINLERLARLNKLNLLKCIQLWNKGTLYSLDLDYVAEKQEIIQEYVQAASLKEYVMGKVEYHVEA